MLWLPVPNGDDHRARHGDLHHLGSLGRINTWTGWGFKRLETKAEIGELGKIEQ